MNAEIDKLLEIDKLFNDWLHSTASPEERMIWGRAKELEEEFFGDMMLADVESELNIDYQQVNITISWKWRFLVQDLKNGVLGACEYDDRCIIIGSTCANDDYILLHEMIHAYEGMLGQGWTKIYQQVLTLLLYEKLKDRFSDLLSIVKAAAKTDQAERTGFVHSPLFLLKSLDLDDRLGLPWGTIHGYEQRDVIDALQVMK